MAADDKFVSIKDLRPGLKNVTCIFIVIDKGTVTTTKDGSIVRKCRAADKTGSIIFSLWNEQAEAIEAGDILKLTRGYASVWKGTLMLNSGKYGVLEKKGEFTMVYSESPDMSDPNQEFTLKASSNHATTGGRKEMAENRNGNNHTSMATVTGNQFQEERPPLAPPGPILTNHSQPPLQMPISNSIPRPPPQTHQIQDNHRPADPRTTHLPPPPHTFSPAPYPCTNQPPRPPFHNPHHMPPGNRPHMPPRPLLAGQMGPRYHPYPRPRSSRPPGPWR